MKKISLEHLKNQQMDQDQMKKITGGWGCTEDYCRYGNPHAWCC